MWIEYKKRVKHYKVYKKDGTSYECRWGWYYFRRYDDQIERVEEFYKWELYERWVGKKKYQKKPHHKKKVKSDKQLAKEAWRQEKGMNKDKAKRQDLHGWRSDGCPVWLKRHCNKKHRQWERRCIEKGKYDKMGSKCKRKDIFDPWMWD